MRPLALLILALLPAIGGLQSATLAPDWARFPSPPAHIQIEKTADDLELDQLVERMQRNTRMSLILLIGSGVVLLLGLLVLVLGLASASPLLIFGLLLVIIGGIMNLGSLIALILGLVFMVRLNTLLEKISDPALTAEYKLKTRTATVTLYVVLGLHILGFISSTISSLL